MEENQSPITGNKQDMIDRKAAWIERMFDRLFGAIQKDVKGTIMILSIALNFYVIKLYVDLNASSKKEMIEEVRRSVSAELPNQLEPIKADLKANQDSMRVNLDSMKKNTDTSLLNLNSTVESFKQKYINKKK